MKVFSGERLGLFCKNKKISLYTVTFHYGQCYIIGTVYILQKVVIKYEEKFKKSVWKTG